MRTRLVVWGVLALICAVTALLTLVWASATPIASKFILTALTALTFAVAASLGATLAKVGRDRSRRTATLLSNLGRRASDINARLDDIARVGALTEQVVNRQKAAEERLRNDLAAASASVKSTTGAIKTVEGEIRRLTQVLGEQDKAIQLVREEIRAGNSYVGTLGPQLQAINTQLESIEGERSSELQTLREEIRRTHDGLLAFLYEAQLVGGEPTTSMLGTEEARGLARRYYGSAEYLRLKPLIEHGDALHEFNLTETRLLFRFFRRSGYYRAQLALALRIAELSKRESDRALVAKLRGEIRSFKSPEDIAPDLGEATHLRDPRGPILHFVGKSLPEAQTGYTLRTQYSVSALAGQGHRVVVAVQSGAPGGSDTETTRYSLDGIPYVILRGPTRGETELDDWLAQNMARLAELVAELRPSVIHAHSDFLNGVIAKYVGSYFSVPVVYETRGFWEESWLSRTVDALQIKGVSDELFAKYGLPEAYVWRKAAEEYIRSQVDANVTLARVMEEHILRASGAERLRGQIALAPNAIDPDAFPVQTRDDTLAVSLGISSDDVVVGYISSIVEYEGIDTLVDAFATVSEIRRGGSPNVKLLIVGDGNYLPHIKAQAAERALSDVVFTGRIPHSEVLKYYGLIDIFVVPRRPTTVSELVTPLKPYEAFATGRALVLSDVKALREIADASRAALTFRSGNADDLASVIGTLLDNPEQRVSLARRGTEWVRSNRLWSANAEVYAGVYTRLGHEPSATDGDVV